MKKSDLIKQVSILCDANQSEVTKIVDCFFNKVMWYVERDEKVVIRNFGTFLPKKRNARKARNVVRGTSVTVPKRTLPSFVPSKEFKWRVEVKCKAI